MSMSQDTENFEQLRQLLALKRHEQPPPGYFNDFSSQVILRIKAGDRGEESTALLERLFMDAPWLQRIWATFEARPALAGVLGVAMCGLLITGVLYSDRTEVSPVSLVPVVQEASAPVTPQIEPAADHPLLAKPAALEASSTNPINAAQTDEALLGNIGSLQAQPASFTFHSGN